jgi:hypothetical protein
MKLTEEWFRQFGRLNSTIGDNGFKYELVTIEGGTFSGQEYAEDKQAALVELYKDVHAMLWFRCMYIERHRLK